MPCHANIRGSLALIAVVWLVLFAAPARGQSPGASPATVPSNQHQHERAATATGPEWHAMGDGVAWALFDRQGGPRGATQVRAPNWWMGMLTRPLGGGNLALTGMVSLEPATVGKCGYAEIFQVGETCNGRPLVDRQHPHDLTMQLAAAWRVPLTGTTGLSVAGGPVGEPALGPVAFMHRPSAAENPVAPLSHHTFDSTHISMGVITAAVDRGPVILEASLFNGREPDENRWNLIDRGPLDSWSARLWVRPSADWLVQVSTGVLKDPEALEPGNVRRTTVSAQWLRTRDAGYSAATVGFGRNDKVHDVLNAFFAEAAHRRRANAFYTRFEAVQTEAALLVPPDPSAPVGGTVSVARVLAWTIGGVHDVWARAGAAVGVGGDVTFYGVPQVLTASHGHHPVSFHLFVRIRPPAATGRMWNMTMTHLVERSEKPMSMPMSMGRMGLLR